MKAIDVESVVGEQTALIVLKETGVKYTAQTGGIGCYHPESEGYVISLGSFMQDFDTCVYGCFYIHLDIESQERLMKAVNRYCETNAPIGRVIRFDESRISEAMEGWIPVILKGSLMFPDINFNGEKGFIHNFNCD